MLGESTHIGAPLAAAANDRDVDLITGSDESRPPEDVAGNQANTSHCSRRAAHEFAPAEAGVEPVAFFHIL